MQTPYHTSECFPSLSALKDAEKELRKSYRESNEMPGPGLLDAIEDFIRKVQATGTVLERERDQRAAEDTLEYWVTRLYRAGREIGSITLADFDPKVAPELDEALCPYVGLDAFSEVKSKYFSGREALVKKLLDRLEHNNLLVVDGPSGSGKSSLVLAGLLPALRSGALPGNWHFYPRMVPGSAPLVNLARTVKPPVANTDDWISRQVECFREDADHLANIVHQLGQPVVLVIDQFEEVFTLTTDLKEREAFERNLVGLTRVNSPRNLLILTMRSDYDSSVPLLPALQPLFDDAVEAPTPPSRADLRAAILEPAEKSNLKFEEGVVDKLVEDLVGERAALPLLQFTLLKLWEKRTHNWVTRQAYIDLGGAREALARSADQFYEHLPQQEKTMVKRILLRLVRPGTGVVEFVANRILRQELYQLAAPSLIEPVLDKLIRERLVRLTIGATIKDDEVEIAHEALIRNWGTLVRWLEEDRGRMTLARRLEGRADEWGRRGKAKYGLLDEFEVREAENWIANPDAEYLGNIEKVKSLVDASRAAVDRERKDKARATKRLRWALIAAVLCALVATALALVAFYGQRKISAEAQKLFSSEETQRALERRQQELETKRQAQDARIIALEAQEKLQVATEQGDELRDALLREHQARSDADILAHRLKDSADDLATANGQLALENEASLEEDLADDAIKDLSFDPDSSAPLAILALKASANVGNTLLGQSRVMERESAFAKTEEALHRIVEAQQTEWVLKHGHPVVDIAFSPDGLMIATAGEDGLKLWNALSGNEDPWPVSTGSIGSAAFSSDGNLLATGSNSGTISVWNTSTRGLEFEVKSANAGGAWPLAFSPDGGRLAMGNRDGLTVWDVRGHRQLESFRGTHEQITALAFSPDGGTLVTNGPNNTAEIWDSNTGVLKQTFAGHNERVLAVAFSRDGRQVATSSEDQTAKLWETASGKLQRTLRGHSAAVTSVAFSPNGNQLATGSTDKTLRIWSTSSGTQLLILRGHTDKIGRVAFSPDGSRLASGSADKTARIWDANSKELLTFKGHDNIIFQLAVSQDGKRIITSSADKTAKVWDAESGKLLLTLMHPDRVYGVAFSGDGTYLVTSCFDKIVRIWNARDGRKMEEFDAPDSALGIAISPDGFKIAVGTIKGNLIVWDRGNKTKWKTDFKDSGGVSSVAFSPDGKLIAVATGETKANIFEAETGKPVRVLEGHQAAVYGVDFSSDGALLATASADKTVKIWDVGSGRLLRTLTGFSEPVWSAKFSPDRKQLVSAGFDGLVQVWNVDSGTTPVTLANNHDRVYAAVFGVDGKHLITAGWDETIRFYTLDPNELMLLALARISHPTPAPSCSERLKQSVCSEMTKFSEAIVLGNRLAKTGDLEGAVMRYQEAGLLFPELGLRPNEQAATVRRMSDEEAKRLTFAGLYAKGQNLATVNPDAAVKSFQQAKLSDPDSNLDPQREVESLITADKKAKQLAAEKELVRRQAESVELSLEEGRLLLLTNRVKKGVNFYKDAWKRDHDLPMSAAEWNMLCWKGSLGKFELEEIVIEACDKAVNLSSGLASFRDSRGVNEALRHRFRESAEDFQAFVNETTDNKKRTQRQGFIQQLRKNINPITPHVRLDLLYRDTVPPPS